MTTSAVTGRTGGGGEAQDDSGYGRARLWLGISGVGLWVVVAAAGLGLGLPRAVAGWAAGLGGGGAAGAGLALGLVVVLYVLLQAPLDVLGGRVLPRRFGRADAAAGAGGFAARWLRGVAVHGAVLWASLVLLTAAGAFGGWVGVVVAGAVGSRVLLLGRGPLSRAVARLRRVSGGGHEAVWDSGDPGFTGGWTGVYHAAVSVRPARWDAVLSPAGRAVARRRRELAAQTGQLRRGRVVALSFTLVGLGVAAALASRTAGPGTAGGTLTLSLWFTLWSFLGLLVLPTVSRRGVAAVDAALLAQGVDPAELAETTRRLDGLQDGEPRRPAWVEAIFHPLPSVENRTAGRTPTRWGAWDANRTAVYLGLSGGSLLTRSVHCNAGRPALWVWLPTD